MPSLTGMSFICILVVNIGLDNIRPIASFFPQKGQPRVHQEFVGVYSEFCLP